MDGLRQRALEFVERDARGGLAFRAGSNVFREFFNLFRLFQQSQGEHLDRIRFFHFGF